MTTATTPVELTDDEIAFQLELAADNLRCFLAMSTDEVTRPVEEDGFLRLSSAAQSKVFALDYAMRKVIDDVVAQAQLLSKRELLSERE